MGNCKESHLIYREKIWHTYQELSVLILHSRLTTSFRMLGNTQLKKIIILSGHSTEDKSPAN